MPSPEDYQAAIAAQGAAAPIGQQTTLNPQRANPEPVIVGSLDRLRTLNSIHSEQVERLRRVVNRVIFGTETVAENNAAPPPVQPARSGLVGAVEDIADRHGELNDQFSQLLGQLNEHI